MKYLLAIYLAFFLPCITHAQDLSGDWQGLEFNPGAIISDAWPSVLTVSQTNNYLDCSLYQVAAKNQRVYVRFKMTTELSPDKITLKHYYVVLQNGPGEWCYGTFNLVYDEVNESLTGLTKYPAKGCPNGKIELYRLKLKSPTEYCKGQNISLTVTGKNVKWYSDKIKRHFLAEGNTYIPPASGPTQFYLTQTFYGVESPVVPVSIKIQDCNPSDLNQSDSITLRGQVFNKNKLDQKLKANLEITPPGKLVPKIETDANGFYSVKLKKGTGYSILTSAESFTSLVTFMMIKDKDTTRNFFMEGSAPQIPDKSISLKNVFFEPTKSDLLPSSYDELNHLAELMAQFGSMEIQLQGHTDKGLNDQGDMGLSIRRVESVKAYLISKGVSESRISCKGFGNTKMLYPSPNQANRRVEFVITKQ